MSVTMSDCECSLEVKDREQSRILWVLLLINAFMFIAELAAGLIAESTGLIADSLDMLADATVYGIGLYAVGRISQTKIRAATVSGVFEVILAIGVALEIFRRLVWGSAPEPLYMVGVGTLALFANVVCVALLSKHRDGEVHMRASWIFSKNDVIANAGVIFAGILVSALDTRLPDLIIGALITAIVFRGGVYIIKDAFKERAGIVRKVTAE